MGIPLTSIITARVVIRGVLAAGGSNAKNIANVFHYRRVAVAVSPSKTALRAIFDSSVVQLYAAAANVDLGSLTIGIRWIDDAGDMDESAVAAPFTAGQIAGERLPSKNAVRVLLRSNVRGANFRGAKSFAGASEADSLDDVLTGAGLTRWQTLQAALDNNLTDASPNTWVPCVYSRNLSIEDVNPTTILTADITSALLNLTLGSMNRRRVATTR